MEKRHDDLCVWHHGGEPVLGKIAVNKGIGRQGNLQPMCRIRGNRCWQCYTRVVDEIHESGRKMEAS